MYILIRINDLRKHKVWYYIWELHEVIVDFPCVQDVVLFSSEASQKNLICMTKYRAGFAIDAFADH